VSTDKVSSGDFDGCVTGHIRGGAIGASSADFSWTGNDEMDEVSGNGDAEIQPDGALHGSISFHHGDYIPFIARKWTSSAAC
jgi:hypothetical protein